MASAGRQKMKGKRPAAPPKPAKKVARPVPKKAKPTAHKPAAPAPKASPAVPKASAKSREPEPELTLPPPDGRRHVLSLSFVRDGDEFLARLESDSGHITEFKNRSLDQLLTLVAGELEDLIE
ncbi:MAG: hypothetical protein ABR888_06625 [Thermoplasmata archaeon]